MMGMLLIAFGILNLLMLHNRSQDGMVARKILVFDLLVAFVSLALSVKYFLTVPVAFTAFAVLCFAAALVLAKRLAKHLNPLKEA